jgi:microcystin-dependent protein
MPLEPPPIPEVPAPRALPAVLQAALESDEALVMIVGAYGAALPVGDPLLGSHVNVDIGGEVITIPTLAGGSPVPGTPAYVIATKDSVLAIGSVGGPGAPAGMVPIGGILPFGGATAPAGFLLCDGTLYSTSLYPVLFSVIAYLHGGSGSSFRVPDLARRVPVGAGTGAAHGASDGLAVASRGIAHHHSFSDSFSVSVSGSTDGVGDHSHAVGGQLDNVYAASDAQRILPSTTPSGAFPTTGAGGHSHGFSGSGSGSVSGDTSGGGPSDGPSFLVLNHIIRAV